MSGKQPVSDHQSQPTERKNRLRHFVSLLNSDWYRAVICLALGFILPEFVAVALLFVSLIFFFRCIKKENLTPRIGKLGILLLAYIGTGFISCLYALEKMHSLWMSLLWLATFIAYLILSTLLTNRSRFRVTLQTLAVVATVCGIIGIAQYIVNSLGYDWLPLNLWWPIETRLYTLFTDQLIMEWLDIRAAATFSNPNLFSMEMIILLPFSAYCMLTAGRRQERLIYAALLLIGLVGMMFSFSRGGYLAVIVVTLVFIILNFARTKVARWATLFLFLAAIAFVVIPNPFMERLATISVDERAIFVRLDGWRVAWEAIQERPIAGYGIGTFNALNLILSGSDYVMSHFHNVVLEIWIEGGLIAIVIYALMAWQVFVPNLKLHHVDDWTDRTLGVTFLAIACGFLQSNMVDFLMSTPKGILTFIMLLALSDNANHLCGIQRTYLLRKRQ